MAENPDRYTVQVLYTGIPRFTYSHFTYTREYVTHWRLWKIFVSLTWHYSQFLLLASMGNLCQLDMALLPGLFDFGVGQLA